MKMLHFIFELPREARGLLPQSKPSELEQHCQLTGPDQSWPRCQGTVWGIFVTTAARCSLCTEHLLALTELCSREYRGLEGKNSQTTKQGERVLIANYSTQNPVPSHHQ